MLPASSTKPWLVLWHECLKPDAHSSVTWPDSLWEHGQLGEGGIEIDRCIFVLSL